MFVDRQRVLERIRRRGTAITALIAPAGYGKSYVAHRIARLEPAWAEVSAANAAAGRFPQRLALALGLQGDAKASAADLAASIGQAWAELAAPLTLIIDDIECLEGDADGLQVLCDLIACDAPRGKLILCARREPGIAFADFAGPHLLTTVRREHLAFDDDELRSVFAETRITDAMLFRLSRFTTGWPLAALSFGRIAREGNLEAVFDRLDPSALGDLYEYVDAHVLDSLPNDLMRALCASVAFEDLRAAEFDHYCGEASAETIIAELSRRFQLATAATDGRIEVCPLIRAVLRARHPGEVRKAQLAVARFCTSIDDIARAAQCYLEAGEIAQAAELLRRADSVTLEALCIFSNLPEQYDATTLACYPEVWAAYAGARRLSEWPDTLAREATLVLESLPADASTVLVNTIVALSALIFMDAGRMSDACDMLNRATPISEEGPHDAGELHLLAARALIDAARGHYGGALIAWHKMQRHVLAAQTWFSQLLWIEIIAARGRGHWEAEYQFIEQMLKAAQQGGAPTIIAMALAEGVFGAWLARDADVGAAYLTQFNLALKQVLPVLLNFGLAANGRRVSPSRGNCWHWDARAYLMSAADNDDPAVAAADAQTALALADRGGSTLLRVLSRVAVAEKVPSSRHRRLTEALEIAHEMESVPLRESLARLIASGEPNGMLTPFVDRLRFRSLVFEPAADVRIAVCLTDGTISRDGTQLTVSDGGLGLVAALAINERAVSRDMLCDRLWPDMPLESARNALKMCVRRTRQQLGDQDAILSTKGGYALGTRVDVDARGLPALRSAVVAGDTADRAVATGAEACFERLKTGRPEAFNRWEWFADTERMMQAATREIGEFVARGALQRGDTARALRIAEFLVGIDPLDEAARALKIETHLTTADRGAAILEFQHYRKLLDRELGVEPSARLKDLLEGPAHVPAAV